MTTTTATRWQEDFAKACALSLRCSVPGSYFKCENCCPSEPCYRPWVYDETFREQLPRSIKENPDGDEAGERYADALRAKVDRWQEVFAEACEHELGNLDPRWQRGDGDAPLPWCWPFAFDSNYDDDLTLMYRVLASPDAEAAGRAYAHTIFLEIKALLDEEAEELEIKALLDEEGNKE